MHPFQSEIHARTELDARWRDAAERRLVRQATPAWSQRTGALLVAVGDRFARTGRRLQSARPAPAACPEVC